MMDSRNQGGHSMTAYQASFILRIPGWTWRVENSPHVFAYNFLLRTPVVHGYQFTVQRAVDHLDLVNLDLPSLEPIQRAMLDELRQRVAAFLAQHPDLAPGTVAALTTLAAPRPTLESGESRRCLPAH